MQFQPFGTEITFLPIVLGNGKIHMEVAPSITDLDPAFGTILAGNLVPGRHRSRPTPPCRWSPARPSSSAA